MPVPCPPADAFPGADLAQRSRQPKACGQPISVASANAAADWLTLLMSGEVSNEERAAWRQWREADPEHERAWRHIEAVTNGRLAVMQPRAAYQTLSPYAGTVSQSRRKALRLLLWGGAIGASALSASRTQTWQSAVADYRTGTGEQRSIALSDGTEILLDTASAIDVQFDSRRRLIRLIAGEVMITTGHRTIDGRPDGRPFIVQTGEGLVRALGTRFIVRQEDKLTAVAVIESGVEITPEAAAGQPPVLHAGERATFSRTAVNREAALTERDLAWTRGQIVAENLRLADFLTELGRYRPGMLRCDSAVADLRLSGVFPLEDTDRILAMLPMVLPIEVRRRTRYWISVEGRS
jgi:transmembrane sensor